MKKVTLLLPDKMIYVKGSFGNSIKTEVDITEKNIIKALTMDDYHMNYFFKDESQITVLKVEEVENGGKGKA